MISQRCRVGINPSAPAYKDFALLTDEANHVPQAFIATNDLGAISVHVILIRLTLITLWHEMCRPGFILAESPLNNIVMVGSPVTILPGTIVPEATPSSAVVAFNTVNVIGFPRGRSQPSVVIQPFRNRCFRVLGGRRETS